MSDTLRRRHAERHGTAVVRALGGNASAELRAQRLRVNGRSVTLASPHLAADLADTTVARARGVADALGLLVRHHDHALHRELAPKAPVERVVFDLLEQLRCEALVPDGLPGAAANIGDAFEEWAYEARAERIGESGVGLLVFTVAHMVRARFGSPVNDPHTDDLIESTRATLAPLIGEALASFPSLRHDQAAFAWHARTIAEAVAVIAGDAALAPADEEVLDRVRLVLAGWDGDDDIHESPDGEMASPDSSTVDHSTALVDLGDYRVFTREHDRQIDGIDLVATRRVVPLREQLDRHRRAQAVSAPRLAQRLRRILARPDHDGWTYAEEEGLLDPARLGQLLVDPINHRVFRRERHEPTADVCVSFLVDTSGSMKAQRYESMAVLIDTFAHALDLAGVASEVLGFTTSSWAGGRSVRAWRRAGQPSNPGRVADVDHIVYKSADQSWRRSRRSLAAMLSTTHYREGVDGEALIWAHGRLQARLEARKILVAVSDGAPMEATTANLNRSGFLDDHLHATAAAIEQRGGVELVGVTLDADVSSVYRRSAALDLSGTLTLATYEQLGDLLRP